MTAGETVDIVMRRSHRQVVPAVQGMILLTSQLASGDQAGDSAISVRGTGEEHQVIRLG